MLAWDPTAETPFTSPALRHRSGSTRTEAGQATCLGHQARPNGPALRVRNGGHAEDPKRFATTRRSIAARCPDFTRKGSTELSMSKNSGAFGAISIARVRLSECEQMKRTAAARPK